MGNTKSLRACLKSRSSMSFCKNLCNFKYGLCSKSGCKVKKDPEPVWMTVRVVFRHLLRITFRLLVIASCFFLPVPRCLGGEAELPTGISIGMSENQFLDVAANLNVKLEKKYVFQELKALKFRGGFVNIDQEPDWSVVIFHKDKFFMVYNHWCQCEQFEILKNHYQKNHAKIQDMSSNQLLIRKGFDSISLECAEGAEHPHTVLIYYNVLTYRQVSAQLPFLLKKVYGYHQYRGIPNNYYDVELFQNTQFVNNLPLLSFSLKTPYSYQANIFDCSEMAAYLEWVLENSGYKALICVRNPKADSADGHAWVIAYDKDNKGFALEPTAFGGRFDDHVTLHKKHLAFFDQVFISDDDPRFLNYLDYDVYWDSIHDIPFSLLPEFDWWNNFMEWPPGEIISHIKYLEKNENLSKIASELDRMRRATGRASKSDAPTTTKIENILFAIAFFGGLILLVVLYFVVRSLIRKLIRFVKTKISITRIFSDKHSARRHDEPEVVPQRPVDLDELKDAACDPDITTRLWAIEELKRIGDSNAATVLAFLVDDNDNDVKIAAREAMREIVNKNLGKYRWL